MASSVAIRTKAIDGRARETVSLVLLDIRIILKSACPDIVIGVGPDIAYQLNSQCSPPKNLSIALKPNESLLCVDG